MSARSMALESAERRMRAEVLREARSWLGTPWHHAQRTKGAGVDCAMFLIEVYTAAGLVEDVDPGQYPPDWYLHRDQERMLDIVTRYAIPTEAPLPGDVALYSFGRCISHAAIIENDEMLLHAYLQAGCVTRSERSSLETRLRGYWSPF